MVVVVGVLATLSLPPIVGVTLAREVLLKQVSEFAEALNIVRQLFVVVIPLTVPPVPLTTGVSSLPRCPRKLRRVVRLNLPWCRTRVPRLPLPSRCIDLERAPKPPRNLRSPRPHLMATDLRPLRRLPVQVLTPARTLPALGTFMTTLRAPTCLNPRRVKSDAVFTMNIIVRASPTVPPTKDHQPTARRPHPPSTLTNRRACLISGPAQSSAGPPVELSIMLVLVRPVQVLTVVKIPPRTGLTTLTCPPTSVLLPLKRSLRKARVLPLWVRTVPLWARWAAVESEVPRPTQVPQSVLILVNPVLIRLRHRPVSLLRLETVPPQVVMDPKIPLSPMTTQPRVVSALVARTNVVTKTRCPTTPRPQANT